MILGHSLRQSISITPSDNKGYILTIGCAKLVYIDRRSLLSDLAEHLADPSSADEILTLKTCVRELGPECGRPNKITSEGRAVTDPGAEKAPLNF